MKRLLACTLLCSFAVAATAAARVGTKANPLVSYPNTNGANWQGEKISSRPFAAEGWNRLYVSADPHQIAADDAASVAIFIRRNDTEDWRRIPATLHGLGQGSYQVAAVSGFRAFQSQHWTWGPETIHFRHRASGRFFWRLAF